MNAVILTPIKLLADGLARYLDGKQAIHIVGIVDSPAAVLGLLADGGVDVVLVDVTQGVDLDEMRALALAAPQAILIALGLKEQRQEVIRCGRAGFSGYVGRDATVDGLATAMHDAVAGRLACPAEISNGLLKALFRIGATAKSEAAEDPALTRRECAVLQLIGRGLTNKEIARELNLSVATVKHHVHNVLGKLNLPRRAHAMQRVRERPWIASASGEAHL